MEAFFQQLIIRIGWSVFPATLFLVFSQNPILKPPSPTPTPTETVSPSPTHPPAGGPTNTVTPTPQPKADPPLAETPSPTLEPTNTPTPSPSPQPKADQPLADTPTQTPITSQQLDEWFTRYSNHFAIDRQKLWKVAVCESNLRSDARNGDYGGLFQFSTYTWNTTRRAMNMDPNPELRFNPEEAIRTAAFKMSTVGLSSWPNCGK